MTMRLLSDEQPDLLEAGSDTLPQDLDFRQDDFPQDAVDEIIRHAENADVANAETILSEAIGPLRTALESLGWGASTGSTSSSRTRTYAPG